MIKASRIWNDYMDSLHRSKRLVAIMCAIGVGLVAYGIGFKNDPIFIIGLIVVVAAYLIIRKHLKDGLKGKQKKEE